MKRIKSSLLLSSLTLFSAFAVNAFSQTVDATVPVKVDISATVTVEPISGKGIGANGSVTANTEKTFSIKLPVGDGAIISPSSSGTGGSGTSSSSQATTNP
ncbi:MAG: hypothetical protein FWC26_10275, partial [Fibromonadales bacterium]|nr:hypothetical protein [Fibromonadales bacterium]